MKNLITVLIIGALAWYGYGRFKEKSLASSAPTPASVAQAVPSRAPAAAQFNCDGRTHCSQMHSCAEATYFLRHCPGTKMDGDNDGVPCEQQWCN